MSARGGTATRGGGVRLAFVGALVLGATAALLALVAVDVIRASADREVRRGLEYGHFLAAVDELLDEVGDDGLLRLEELKARLPDGRTVQYDTLLVVADQTRFPAFAPGGFLHDQTVAFNRFQRERLTLSRVEPRMFDRLAAYNPSIFRAYRRGDGTRGVTRTAAAWDLQVPSPFAEEWEGEVRANDVYRGRGVYGASAAMSFRRPASVTRRVSGRPQRCELRPDSVDVRAYCLSESRVPQVTFKGAVDPEREAIAVAGWTGLWVDGREVEAGDSMALGGGAVLEIEPLAPLVFGEYWDGVLSTKQWINGRLGRRSASEKPLDMFASLGSGWDGSTSGGGSLELTVDTEASRELSGLLQDFIERRVSIPVELGMIVIASVPDGAIRAVAEVGRRRIPGRSSLLERFAPGSAVKPVLAAAILSQRPELGTLQIPARSGPVSSVLGFTPTRIPFQSTLNCPFPSGGFVGLRYFIRCSNNAYAATLLAAGLWQRDATTLIPTRRGADPAFRLGRRSYAAFRPEPTVTGLRVDRSELLGSPLADGMAELFDVSVDPVIVDTKRRSQRVWEGLTFTNGAPFDPPFAQRPAESRPVLLSGQQDEYSDLALLYRYAYGAWENRWNIFDLATAFGRVVTDRRVRLRFARDGARARDSEELGLTGQPWYGELLASLGDVAVDGTASDVRNRWRRAGLPSTVFAKTGTLTEAGGPSPADDLYIKSLLFGVGEGGRNRGPLMCGLVGAVYLEFESGPRRGSLPSYQVELARNELGEFLAREWREAGICERPVSDR